MPGGLLKLRVFEIFNEIWFSCAGLRLLEALRRRPVVQDFPKT